MLKRLIMAMQFLTIVPLPVRTDWGGANMSSLSGAFPLVGLLLGFVAAGCAAALSHVFGPALTTALVMLVLAASNGGLHLDGLADTFDAIATRGDRERKLRSMKDSSVGPMGVVAIVFDLGVKYLVLVELASASWAAYLGALTLMLVASRWAMVASMYHGTSARPEGLGHAFIEGMRGRYMAEATVIALVSLAVPSLMLADLQTVAWHIGLIVALLATYGFVRIATKFCRTSFGGHTGDTLGATAELSELIFLMTVLAWQRLYI